MTGLVIRPFPNGDLVVPSLIYGIPTLPTLRQKQ